MVTRRLFVVIIACVATAVGCTTATNITKYMSYDLMVFNQNFAPKTRVEFLQWYQRQTEWTEQHSYDDPAVSSKELQNWFMDMVKVFPALNGPYATDEESETLTDYSVGRDVIYAAFSWSMAGEAHQKVLELAEKHQVGFFDVSSDDGDILIPVNGKLKHLETGEKRNWWRFW